MTQFERALAWVNYAEENWWNPEGILPPIRLSEHVRKIVEVLEAAREYHHEERVWMEIERVRAKYITMEPFDAGLAQKLCARAALELSRTRDALELFIDARDNLGRGSIHHYAVVTWMLGCVYWMLPDRHNRAIDAWQETIHNFERISGDAGTNSAKTIWYREQHRYQFRALESAIENDLLPTVAEIVGEKKAESSIRFAEELVKAMEMEPESEGVDEALEIDTDPEPEVDEPAFPIENYFQLFVVYDEIPAGLPGPVAYSPSMRFPAGHTNLQADDFIEVTRVRIGDQEYAVRSLNQSTRRVNLTSDSHHYVMRVRGNSMNLAGIEDDDLVILRSQMIAQNNDIVAAEIVGVDESRATLKRYLMRAKRITLSAESDDLEFTGREWDFTTSSENASDGFFIRGVAVAVLKPI